VYPRALSWLDADDLVRGVVAAVRVPVPRELGDRRLRAEPMVGAGGRRPVLAILRRIGAHGVEGGRAAPTDAEVAAVGRLPDARGEVARALGGGDHLGRRAHRHAVGP